MKEYEISNKVDFQAFVNTMYKYFNGIETFPKLMITVKRFRKSKTPAQHKYYWVCITELKKVLNERGNDFSREEIHEFIKQKHGFTKTEKISNGEEITVTKSIANNSKDINIENMNGLIDFVLKWSIEKLNHHIQDPRS